MIGAKKGITSKDKNHKHFLFENTPNSTNRTFFGPLMKVLKIWQWLLSMQTKTKQPAQQLLEICLDLQQGHNIHLWLSFTLLN